MASVGCVVNIQNDHLLFFLAFAFLHFNFRRVPPSVHTVGT
jgi:hypothetical protein